MMTLDINGGVVVITLPAGREIPGALEGFGMSGRSGSEEGRGSSVLVAGPGGEGMEVRRSTLSAT